MEDFNKDFKEWLINQPFGDSAFGFACLKIDTHLTDFNKLPFCSKWGVYLAFFDRVGVEIYTMPITTLGSGNVEFFCEIGDIETKGHPTRQEAQKEAIKKAIEVYNID